VAISPVVLGAALIRSDPAVIRMPVLVLCAAGYGIALAWIGVRIAARAAGKGLPELCQIANSAGGRQIVFRARHSTAGGPEVPRGIGHATARMLAERGCGYRVAGTARKPSAQSNDGVDMLPLAAAATIYPGWHGSWLLGA
jgi:hypothetical protein